MASGYVQPVSGGWVVVVDGSRRGGVYTNQGEAERAFNDAVGQPNAAAPAAGDGGVSLDQMRALLEGAHYNGPTDEASIRAAYARTVAGTGGGGGPSGGTSFDPTAAQYAMQLAQAAANQAYLNERLHQLEIPEMQAQTEQAKEQLAFQKAQQAWTETYQQGLLDFQGKSQEEQNAISQGALTGTFNGTPTLAATTQAQQNAISQGALTGTYGGAPTLAAKQGQDQTTLGLLNLLGSLKGPANAFQYAKVLEGTPGGLKDIVNAAAGRFQLPGFGGGDTGQLAPSTLQSIMGDLGVTPGEGEAVPPYVAPPPAGTPTTPAAPTYQMPQDTNALFAKTMKAYTDYKAQYPGAPWNQQTYMAMMGQLGVPQNIAASLWQQAGANGAPKDPYTFRIYLQNAINGGTGTATPAAPTAAPTAAPATPGAPAPGGLGSWVLPYAEAGSPTAAPTAPTGGGYSIQPVGAPVIADAGGGGRYIPGGTAGDVVANAGANAGVATGDAGFFNSKVNDPATPVTPYIPNYGALPAPNQINAQNFNNMDTSQKQLLLGAYQDKGWNQQDVLDEYMKSLPKYGGPARGIPGFG